MKIFYRWVGVRSSQPIGITTHHLLIIMHLVSKIARNCPGDQHSDIVWLLAFLPFEQIEIIAFTGCYLFIGFSKKGIRLTLSKSLRGAFKDATSCAPRPADSKFLEVVLGMYIYVILKIVKAIHAHDKKIEIFIMHRKPLVSCPVISIQQL